MCPTPANMSPRCLGRRLLCQVITVWLTVVIFSYMLLRDDTADDGSTAHLGDSVSLSVRGRTGDADISDNLRANHSDSSKSQSGRPPDSRSDNGRDGDQFISLPSDTKSLSGAEHQDKRLQRRIKEFCNPPEGMVASGEEGEVPKDYTLQSVHVILRHGDRSPMYKLPNQESPRLSCLLDTSSSDAHRQLISRLTRTMRTIGHQVQHGQSFGLYPRQTSCMGAQLTAKGAVQLLVLGDTLRKVYMMDHSLFSNSLNPDKIDIRSTEYSRTYQSAISFLHGFVPELPMHKINIKTTKNMYFCDEMESGLPCSCPVTSKLKEFAKKEEINMKTGLTSSLMQSIRAEVGSIYGLKNNQVPWIGGIVEVLMGYVCHSLPLPCSVKTINGSSQQESVGRCVTYPLIDKMWRYLDTRGEILLSGHADYKHSMLVSDPLLRQIAQDMLNVTTTSKWKRFSLYSGHDMTITSLAKALGIHDGHWPPYASRLVFELYSDDRSQYYVRVIYNGKNRTPHVIFCDKDVLRNNMCPLSNFVDFAFHHLTRTFSKDSFHEICQGI